MWDRPIIAVIAVVASLALATAPARADRRLDDAKQQVNAADIAYRLGRFEEALAKYSRAYELYPVAGLLFNIAQCHKNLKDYEKAIFFYEGYLRDAPNAPNRALVKDLIRESQAELDRARARAPEPPPPADVPPAPVAAPPAPEPATSVAAPPHDARPATEPSRRPVLLSSALIAGGVVAGGAGGAFYYYGQKRGPSEKYVYADTRVLGGVLVAVGAGAIATGAVLLLRHPTAAPVVAVAPSGAYAGWAGAF